VQSQLPGRTLVVPEDGVIRRWAVRSARGELSLAVVRPRGGGAFQVARSMSEFAEHEGIHVFPTDLAVERGDLIGLVVTKGSGIGAHEQADAATKRWIPRLAGNRPPDLAGGTGFDDELLLRVELLPGGEPRLPRQVAGSSAERLPPGRVDESRRLHFTNGRPVEIDLVAVGEQFVLDELLNGRRTARIDVPDMVAGAQIITFEVEANLDLPEDLGIYVQFVGEDSARIVSHYFAATAHEFEFVN
jgi:hypothetical protein